MHSASQMSRSLVWFTFALQVDFCFRGAISRNLEMVVYFIVITFVKFFSVIEIIG